MEYKTITLERDGDRPLRGMLALLGEGKSGSGGNSGYSCDWTRGVNIEIYCRQSGGYAVSRHFWSRWQGESDRYEAWTADTPEAGLESLYGQERVLRDAERAAWDQACKQNPELQPLAYEEI